MENVCEKLRWCINEIWKNDEMRKNIQAGTYNIDIVIEKDYVLSKKDISYHWNINASVLRWENGENTFVRSNIVLLDLQEDDEKKISNIHRRYDWEKYVNVEINGKCERIDEFISKIVHIELGGKKIGLVTKIHSNLFLAENGIITLQIRYLYICTIKNILSIEQGQAFFSESLSGIFDYISKRMKNFEMVKKSSKVLPEKLDVILEPNIAALVTHELCHTFEKNNLISMVGKKITSELITIKDKPYANGSWANRRYDDAGKKLVDCYVIKTGILCSVGNKIGGRRLYCEKDRTRFMINTSLVSSVDDIKFGDIIEKIKDGIVLIDVVGAVNDGKNIFLRRCVFREICNGKLGDTYYMSEISFRIVDVLQCMIPLGKKNILVNGVCTNQYEVSYSAPFMELKSIMIKGKL